MTIKESKALAKVLANGSKNGAKNGATNGAKKRTYNEMMSSHQSSQAKPNCDNPEVEQQNLTDGKIGANKPESSSKQSKSLKSSQSQ